MRFDRGLGDEEQCNRIIIFELLNRKYIIYKFGVYERQTKYGKTD